MSSRFVSENGRGVCNTGSLCWSARCARCEALARSSLAILYKLSVVFCEEGHIGHRTCHGHYCKFVSPVVSCHQNAVAKAVGEISNLPIRLEFQRGQDWPRVDSVLCSVCSTVIIEPSFVFLMGSIMLPPVQDTREILAMDQGWRWPFRRKGALSPWQTWDWIEQLGVLEGGKPSLLWVIDLYCGLTQDKVVSVCTPRKLLIRCWNVISSI